MPQGGPTGQKMLYRCLILWPVVEAPVRSNVLNMPKSASVNDHNDVCDVFLLFSTTTLVTVTTLISMKT